MNAFAERAYNDQNPASSVTSQLNTLSISMLWIISGLLCIGLVVAMLGVMFPDLVLPVFAKLWDRDSYYNK